MIQLYIVLNDVKQDVYKYIIPSSVGDKLILTMPLIIHTDINDWIINNNKCDLFLNTSVKRFSFYDAIVYRHSIKDVGEGSVCRDLIISFNTMVFGWRKRKNA